MNNPSWAVSVSSKLFPMWYQEVHSGDMHAVLIYPSNNSEKYPLAIGSFSNTIENWNAVKKDELGFLQRLGFYDRMVTYFA